MGTLMAEITDLINKNISVKKNEQATKKLGIIKGFENFSATYVRNGGTRTEALEVYAAQQQISTSSLKRWIASYRDKGAVGLIDNRGGNRFSSEQISFEAFELFKSMYLTPQQRSVKLCYQNLNYINLTEKHNWQIPSLRAMYRYVKQCIPYYVEVLHREGIAAYEAKCAPYIEVDPDSIALGQIWVGDHSQLNCWVRYRNRWIRPWVTCWQDMSSRTIVGWWLSASPNQTTILLAMKRGIEQYGPPETVKIDNGKDYDSEMWTGTTKAKRKMLRAGYIDEEMVAGIYAMLDISISFAIPYHPQSKRIERFFDTLDIQFIKTMPTYCGKDAERKPDYLKDLLESPKTIAEAYDLDSFAELFGGYIEAYNNSAHTGRGMNRQSPNELMASRQSRRVLKDGVLELLMRVWSGELTVGKNGVRFKGMYYGQYDPELLLYQGKKVRVAYDPDDLRSIYVYDTATLKLLTIAEQNQLVRYGTAVAEENLRLAMQQKSKALKLVKSYKDNQLTANMNIADLTVRAMQDAAKEIPEENISQTIKPVRTPLDKQVREHKRKEVIKRVKRAAGAEHIETVLDMDFSLLKDEPEKIKLEFFSG
jgi:transposase InsO family protein